MELISKEEAMRLLKEDLDASRSRGDDERADVCLFHYIEISNIPTIEERKDGKWLDNKWLGEKCSVCSWELHYIDFGQFKYCPNCGAKMKGE